MELFKMELLKIKKSYLLFTAVVTPIPVVFIVLKRIQSSGGMGGLNSSDELFMFSSIAYVALILPLLNIYTACIVTKVENENSGWKQLMLLPVKKSSIYLSKYKVMILALVVSLVSYIISINFGGSILSKDISLNLNTIKYGLQILVTTLPIITFLFIIGRRFISIIPIISVGTIMLITNIFIAQSKLWIYVPWTYPMMMLGGNISILERNIALILSLLLSGLLFTIDFISFIKADVK